MTQFFRLAVFLFTCQAALGQVDTSSTKMICFAEPQPSFPGGIDSLASFLAKNIRYSTEMRGCEGMVLVSFVVTEDGTVTNVEILKKPCARLNKVVLDLFVRMPKWLPATTDGKAVQSSMILPLKFRIGPT